MAKNDKMQRDLTHLHCERNKLKEDVDRLRFERNEPLDREKVLNLIIQDLNNGHTSKKANHQGNNISIQSKLMVTINHDVQRVV